VNTYTDKHHEKITRKWQTLFPKFLKMTIFWQKYFHFEKIWGKLSVFFSWFLSVQALNDTAPCIFLSIYAPTNFPFHTLNWQWVTGRFKSVLHTFFRVVRVSSSPIYDNCLKKFFITRKPGTLVLLTYRVPVVSSYRYLLLFRFSKTYWFAC